MANLTVEKHENLILLADGLDLRKILPLPELGTDELKILLSPGSVSVDTLTGEKEFLTVRDSSGDVVVLRKSSGVQ